MFNSLNPSSSNDRLKRVRCFSKFSNDKYTEEFCDDEELELYNMIMLGDYICSKVPIPDKSLAFSIGKIKSMKIISDKVYKTVSTLTNFIAMQFQVSISKGDVTNDILILKGEVSSSVYAWNGKSCAGMDIRGNCIEVKKVFNIMSALTVADCVTVDCPFLPYISSLAESVGETEASNIARDKYIYIKYALLLFTQNKRKGMWEFMF